MAVVLQLALPVVVRHVVDDLSDGRMTATRLAWYVAGYLAATLATVWFSRNMRRFPLRIAHKVEFDIREELFAKLTLQDAAFYQRARTGDLITRATSDLAVLRDALGQFLLQGTRTTLMVLLAFGVMFATEWRLALVLLVLFPAMLLTFYLFIALVRRRHEAVQEQLAEVSNYAQETFANIRTLKGFAAEMRRNLGFEQLSRELQRRTVGLSLVQQPLWPLFAFWFSLGVALILWVGGRQVVLGRTTLGTVVQFIQYMMLIYWPMLSLSWVAMLVQRGRTSWSRIRAVLDREPAVRDRPDSETPPRAAGEGPPDIRFEKVGLLAGEQRVLNGIDLHVSAGETLGITGPTGSGKTALVSLIPRLSDPSEGRILLDGRDVRDFPLQDLRARIGFAEQEPVLFSLTLAENLAFGLDQPHAATIEWAAGIAHLQGDIDRFPEGYATALGERGLTLSGGQRQRASLGRALARRPRTLILDDVLAAVDTETEAAILDGLQPVLHERTTLLIGHRISTLRHADRIVVIEEGRITQSGTHADLERTPGYYRQACRLQRASAAVEGRR